MHLMRKTKCAELRHLHASSPIWCLIYAANHRCYRSDVKVTGPHSPAEEHVDYDIAAGYVKVSTPLPALCLG